MSKKMGAVRKNQGPRVAPQRQLRRLGLSLPAAGGLVLGMAPTAHAFQVYDGSSKGNNLEISLQHHNLVYRFIPRGPSIRAPDLGRH